MDFLAISKLSFMLPYTITEYITRSENLCQNPLSPYENTLYLFGIVWTSRPGIADPVIYLYSSLYVFPLTIPSVLFFQALDAFLGMDRYLTDENMLRYIPFRQRELCLAFKRSCFRGKLDGEKDAAIGEEIRKIVNQMKVGVTFRKYVMVEETDVMSVVVQSGTSSESHALLGATCPRAAHHDGWKVCVGGPVVREEGY